jgi:hypothetical protein
MTMILANAMYGAGQWLVRQAMEMSGLNYIFEGVRD